MKLVYAMIMTALVGLQSMWGTVVKADFISGSSPIYDNGQSVYKLLKPPGYSPTGTNQYPMVIWLHGIGERGGQNGDQLGDGSQYSTGNGILDLANNSGQAADPCFIFAPLLASGDWVGGETRSDTLGNERRLLLAIKDVMATYRIDPSRVYVMGLSWGGSGTWDMATLYRDMFAAAVPMSLGGTMGTNGAQLKAILSSLPIWSFCGAADTGYLSQNRDAVNYVRSAGGRVIFTLFTNQPHGMWGYAASDPDFYRWLMAQRRWQVRTTDVNQPWMKINQPTQGYTGSGTISLNGTASLASGTMNNFSPVQWNLNGVPLSSPDGGPWTTGSGTTSWTASGIALSGSSQLLHLLGTVNQLTGPQGGVTTFNDTLSINDATAPSLTVTGPTGVYDAAILKDRYTSPSDTLNFRGLASDNQMVTKVTWTNSTTGKAGLAGAEIDNPIAGQVAWIMREVPLAAGDNDITITAYDLAGNAASKNFRITRPAAGGGDFFKQDFNSSSVLSSYVNTTTNPPSNSFYALNSQSGNKVWSISGNALLMQHQGSGLAGFFRKYAMDGLPDGMMVMSFDLTLSATGYNNYTNLVKFGVGSLVGQDSYGVTGWGAMNTELQINGNGSNQYTFKINNTSATTNFSLTDNTTRTVRWYINSTGGALQYYGPDGSLNNLPSDNSAVWIGNSCVIAQAVKNSGYGSRQLSQFFCSLEGADNFTMKLDNFACSDLSGAQPPTVTINSPTTNSTWAVSTASVTLGGTATDAAGTITGVTWKNLSTGAQGTATGTNTWSAPSIALVTGVNNLEIKANNSLGASGTDSIAVTYTVSAPAPTISITTPSVNPLLTNATTVALAGNAGNSPTQISWKVNSGSFSTTNVSGTTAWSISSVPLVAGDNTITVRATNATGSTDATTVVKQDATNPTLSITAPTPNPTTAATVALSGTAGDANGISQVTWTNSGGGSGTATLGTPNGTSTTWNIASVSLAAGSNTVTVTAKDAANNTFVQTVSVVRDNTAPTVVISSTPATTTVSTVSVSGTATDAFGISQVKWRVNGGSESTATFTAPSSWSIAAVPLTAGANVIEVRAQDVAGNYSGYASTTVTYSPPIGSAGWVGTNMNGSSPAGSFSHVMSGTTGDTFTITGGGTELWNSTDNFYYVSQDATGNCSIQARITGVGMSASGWGDSRAGVMIRTNTTGGSNYIYVGRTAGGTVSMYTNISWDPNGAPFITPSGPAYWVKLERDASNNQCKASTAPDVSGVPGTWTQLGTTRVVTMASTVQVGMAVCRNDTGSANSITATLDHVETTGTLPPPPAWTNQGIGAGSGSFTQNGSSLTVQGSGANLGGNDNDHNFVYQDATDNCEIVAKVSSMTDPNGSISMESKAGVMIRDGLLENGAYIYMALQPSWGSQACRHPFDLNYFTGAGSVGAPPYWVRLKRTGPSSFIAYEAPNSATPPATDAGWTQVGSWTDIPMGSSVKIGLMVHSRKTTPISVIFDQVTVTP
jgi:poly(3-hydroxybutyrate) depolymerase